jgi:hypothetical protein
MTKAKTKQGPEAPAEPKISATLVDFVRPILDALGGGPGEHALREVFAIGVAVWNAHVLAMPAWGDGAALERVRAHLRGPDAPLHHAHYFGVLAERRLTLFATDPRFVREWSLEIDPPRPFALRCTAVIPKKR